MATAVIIPKLGNTVENCILGEWKVTPGAQVKKGEVLLEIETDKTVFEIEATADGTLLETFFQAGELVPVLSNIAVIGKQGEDPAPFRPAPAAEPVAQEPPPRSSAPVTQPETPAAVPAPAGVPPAGGSSPAPARESPPPAAPSPRARAFLKEHGLSAGGIQGSGPGGRILERDARRAFFSGRRRSFLARRLLADGWVPHREGSGIGGMLTSADLRPPGRKLSTIRSTIARRMHASLGGTAQFTLANSARATALLSLRKRIKPLARQGKLANITLNDMVNFALVRTLCEHPALNAEYIDGSVYQSADVNLAFACDTGRGLVVPVIRQAQRLSLSQLCLETARLAAHAQAGTSLAADLSGGTFTSTNIGQQGIEYFTPILNTPQVGILGVCTLVLKPLAGEHGITFAQHINLCLTVDHQVIDGAPAARFLAALKEKLENFDKIAQLGLQEE